MMPGKITCGSNVGNCSVGSTVILNWPFRLSNRSRMDFGGILVLRSAERSEVSSPECVFSKKLS